MHDDTARCSAVLSTQRHGTVATMSVPPVVCQHEANTFKIKHMHMCTRLSGIRHTSTAESVCTQRTLAIVESTSSMSCKCCMCFDVGFVVTSSSSASIQSMIWVRMKSMPSITESNNVHATNAGLQRVTSSEIAHVSINGKVDGIRRENSAEAGSALHRAPHVAPHQCLPSDLL